MARFLQLSDLHLVRDGQKAWGVLDTAEILERAVSRITDMRRALGEFDAALITGDLSEDGSANSYAVARKLLNRLELPLRVIPGNHDDRAALRAAFADVPGVPGEGPVDWFDDFEGARLIGLDTLVEGQGGGNLSKQSLDLLRRAIAEAPSDDITLAIHHPPLRSGIAFMDRISLDNAEALLEVLDCAPGPVRIVAGHVHSVFHSMLEKHPVSTAPSVCSGFALDTRTEAPVGFFSGPAGFAVIETGADGYVSAIALNCFEGPFPFRDV